MVIAVATPIIFVMRIYGDLVYREKIGSKHNIPYDYSFTVIITEHTATLEGFTPKEGTFNLGHKNAIFDELRSLGMEYVRWIRIKNGKEKEFKTKL